MGAASLGFSIPAIAAPPPNRRVIVIGAGIAGLAAANELSRRRFSVRVIESRTRLGGRIWTDRSTGTPFDLGASWIHGTRGNPITGLARRARLTPVPTMWNQVRLVDSVGREFSDSDWKKIDPAVEEVLRRLTSAGRRALPDQTPAAQIELALSETGLSGALLEACRWLVDQEVSGEYAADANQLSLAAWRAEGGFPGPDAMLRDGYDRIIDLLARGLDIETDLRVEAIEIASGRVRIRHGNGVEEADHVIITVPLGVLKAGGIAFDPGLPPEKLAALSRLGMGLLDKLGLVFPTLDWAGRTQVAGGVGESPMTFYPLGGVTGRPALAGLIHGSPARGLQEAGDQAVMDMAMASLRRIFGGGVPDPIAFVRTRWAGDPHALGSYSFVPAGASLADYEILSRPIDNRIFFAGEATHPTYPSTVHGAYLSGLREARRIQRL